MPTIYAVQNAVLIAAAAGGGVFTTVEVIQILMQVYYSNIATTGVYAYNARIGKMIKSLPGIDKLREETIHDRNGRCFLQ